jgi:hypothetical protein
MEFGINNAPDYHHYIFIPADVSLHRKISIASMNNKKCGGFSLCLIGLAFYIGEPGQKALWVLLEFMKIG